VVDWIQLPHWPVFNVADSCIVCGGVLAVLLAARGIPLDGHRRQAAGPGSPEATPGPRSAAVDGTTVVPDRPATPRPSSDGTP
jgi:signal peptidase II